jgi:hypothetical protein
MLFLKFLLFATGLGLFVSAAIVVLYDIYLACELDRLLRRGASPAADAGQPSHPPMPRIRRTISWDVAGKLAATAVLPLLLSLSIVVVPDGNAGVRISQISGVEPGTLYPGVHFITPLVERVALYDVRDRVFSTAAAAV